MTQKGHKIKYVAYHEEAVELRYQGKTYAEISAYLTDKYKQEFSVDRLRRWFMKGGILEERYYDYSKKENDRRRKLMMEDMKKVASKIPKVLDEVIEEPVRHPFTGKIMTDENGNPIRKRNGTTVKAVQTIVDMLGFKVEDGDESDPLDEFFERQNEHLPDSDNEEHQGTV